MLIIFLSLALFSMADAGIFDMWNEPTVQILQDGQLLLSPNQFQGGSSWIVNMTGATQGGEGTAQTGTGTPVRTFWQNLVKFFQNEPEVITLTGFSRASTDGSLELVDGPELVLVEPELEPVYLELPVVRSQLHLLRGQRRASYRMFV